MANLSITAVEQPQSAKPGAQAPGILVLRVDGEIDTDTIGVLRKHLEEAESKGHEKLVLDLREAKYMSSAAVAMLVKFAEKFREHGPRIERRSSSCWRASTRERLSSSQSSADSRLRRRRCPPASRLAA